MTRRTSWHAVIAALLLLALTGLATGCAAGPGVGDEPVSEDRRITEEVLRIIADRDDIVAEDIEVETRDGVVVLSGIQPALEPVGELLQRVARVRGVTEVVNRIRIVRSPDARLTPGVIVAASWGLTGGAMVAASSVLSPT